MNNIYKKIIEYTSSGEISKQAAIKLLGMLKNEETLLTDDIAITGIALKFPGAETTTQFWENISNKIDLISNFPEQRRAQTDEYFILKYGLEEDKLTYQPGAYIKEIENFDYRFFKLSPKEASLMDPAQRLFLQTAWKAFEDAGYSSDALRGTKTGIFVGYSSNTDYHNMIEALNPEMLGYSNIGNMPVLLPARIAYLMDLRGPAMILDTACSSSLVAINLACQSIRNKECSMALAGGVRLNLITMLMEEERLGIESTAGQTRSFDENADGTVWGEGVATVVLKPLNQAKKDGDNIYAVIKGIGVNQDGASIGITAPNAKAQAEAIVKAWEMAGVSPETISYIEAHGTATNLGDPLEIEGITKAFIKHTDKKQFCAISTVKSNMGHLYECAGMAGLIKAVLALKYKKIPPCINFTKPNAKIDFCNSPLYINVQTTDWKESAHPRRCGVSSFGFSGTNCHIILEEYDKDKEEPAKEENGLHLLTFSAKTEAGVIKLINNYREYFASEASCNLQDICYTANVGRTHYNYRYALLGKDKHDFLSTLDKLSVDPGLVDLNNVFYGFHEVVSSKKQDRADGEIFEFEKKDFSNHANQLVKDYINNIMDSDNQLREICRFYIQGALPDFKLLYTDRKRSFVSLPNYPFDNRECWLKSVPKNKPINDLLYTMTFKETPLTSGIAANQLYSDQKIALIRRRNCTNALMTYLSNTCREFKDIEVDSELDTEQETDRVHFNKNHLCIKNTITGHKNMFEALEEENCSSIFHMCTLNNQDTIDSLEQLKEVQEFAANNLFYLAQGYLLSNSKKKYRILIITDYAKEVTGTEAILKPHNATSYGIGKVINKEIKELECRFLDFDYRVTPAIILQESMDFSNDYAVAYREDRRYTEVFMPVLNHQRNPLNAITLKDGGTYVITGGLGGIGLAIAGYLAKAVKANIILINRSKLPPKETWEEYLQNNTSVEYINKIKLLRDMEQNGTTIECLQADVSDETALKDTFAYILEKYKGITGIIHSAGIAADKPIKEKSRKEFNHVFEAKVYGTWLIDRLTKHINLDFLIMFSSIATLFTSYGQSDYAAANSFIDTFNAYRNRQNKKTVTINWTTWLETGMAADSKSAVDAIFKTLKTKTALNGFETVLNSGIAIAVIGKLNYDGVGKYLLLKSNVALSEQIIKNIQAHSNTVKESKSKGISGHFLLLGRDKDTYTFHEEIIGRAWNEILGYSDINIYDNFFELGGDSIMGVKIANYLSEKTGKNITSVDMLKYLTINELAEYMDTLTSQASLYPPIVPVERNEYYPASYEQISLYLANKFNGPDTNYNMYRLIEVMGEIEDKKIENTLLALINRHEILRTEVSIREGEVVQKIKEDLEFHLEVVNADKDTLDSIVKEFRRPFDMSCFPLFRVGMIHINPKQHIILLDLHHSVTDGVSMEIFKNDFIHLYKGEVLPELKYHYKDYAVWQKQLQDTPLLKEQKQYWMNMFDKGIPKLSLPTDFIRPEVLEFKGAFYTKYVNETYLNRIVNISSEIGVSNYVIFLSAYYILLSKYAAQTELVVGVPVFGRHIPELKEIMGIFVRTLPIVAKIDNNATALLLIHDIKDTLLTAFKNQDIDFGALPRLMRLPKDLSRHVLFDTTFVLQNIEKTEEKFSQVTCEFRDDKIYNISDYDLTLEVKLFHDYIQFTIEYNQKLFKEDTMQRILKDYIGILNDILNQINIPIQSIELQSVIEYAEQKNKK